MVPDLEPGGERVNLAAQQVRDVLFMVSNTPASGDPCSNGGTSKIFVVDPVTGKAPKFAVFDINKNTTFDSAEVGFNVKVNRAGLLTQPIFQLPAFGSASVPVGVTVSPYAPFDRGQATAARMGGVELSRSSGTKVTSTGTGTSSADPCGFTMTAAQSDTSLISENVNACSKKTRISWRQVK